MSRSAQQRQTGLCQQPLVLLLLVLLLLLVFVVDVLLVYFRDVVAASCRPLIVVY